MKKIILFIISLGLAFGGGRYVSTNYGGMKLGALSDPFISIQLAASPSNGLCLTTDGTNNSWASCSSGSGAAFAYTPALNFGVNTNSTTTPVWFRNGFMSSTTAQMVYASSTAFTVSGNSYLGTISSGVWNGTTIAIANGGTGLTVVGASSTVLTTNGSVAQWNQLATSQLVNDSGFGTGSVTSIATTYPVTGGTITTTGTIALAFGTTTSNTWAGLQTFTNSSTSIGSFSNALFIPTSATAPTMSGAGQLLVETTNASTSLVFATSTSVQGASLFASADVSSVIASSTLAYFSSTFGATGSTTLLVRTPWHPNTLLGFRCVGNGGSVNVEIGTGSATSTMAVCSTTGKLTILSGTNTWTSGQPVYYTIGNSGTGFNYVTVTATWRQEKN